MTADEELKAARDANRTLHRRAQQLEGVWEAAMAESHNFALCAFRRVEEAQRRMNIIQASWNAALAQRERDMAIIRNGWVVSCLFFAWAVTATAFAIIR